jgi:hypothetical protein
LKRILSILLIVLIVFNAGGYFFIYHQLEYHFKQIAFNKINEYIPLEELEKIVIDNKSTINITDIIDDREILHCGKMYDIYKVDFEYNNIVLFCINDENEDTINHAFSEYLFEQSDDTNEKAIVNIMKLLITTALVPIHNYNKPIQLQNNISVSYGFSLQKIEIDIPFPPPRLIS